MHAPNHRLQGTPRWRGREIVRQSGCWAELRSKIPLFEIQRFSVDGGTSFNPYLTSVVRMPLNELEAPMPVGVVSPSYALAQHRDLGDRCVETLKRLDLYYDRLNCELELTVLGEWMALRFYLGDDYSLTPPDQHPLDLRVELFNSVDGSGRLVLAMSWFRLVCKNGLFVRETLIEFADVHDRKLDLAKLDDAIAEGLRLADEDRARMSVWFSSCVTLAQIAEWVDGPLAAMWGKKAAARCLYICRSGEDAEYVYPFEGGKPSNRHLRATMTVPGAQAPARTTYDVAQALSWIATARMNVEERLAWQTDVPHLIAKLEESMVSGRDH